MRLSFQLIAKKYESHIGLYYYIFMNKLYDKVTGACEKNSPRHTCRYMQICVLGRKIQVEPHILIYRYIERRLFFSHAPVLRAL